MNHADLTRDFWRFSLRVVKVLSAVLASMGLVLAPWVSAQSVVVEDWVGHQQNATGVPTGWKKPRAVARKFVNRDFQLPPR